MTELYNATSIEALRQGVDGLKSVWGLSEQTRIELLTISENATFRADDPERKTPVIFRVHRPDYHTRAEIESELAWINALHASRVVDVPAPLPADQHGHIASFDLNGDRRDVVAFEFISGSEPSARDDLVPGFRKLGAITARLHAHVRNWPLPAGFTRKTWTFDTMVGSRPLWGDWRAARHLSPEGKAIIERCCHALRDVLAAYGRGPDRFGLVHADLRLANLLIGKDDRITVIDFDDCGFSWLMYDFAAAVSFYEHEAFIPDLLMAWLDGYRSVTKLSVEHEAMIPAFVMLRRILLTAWITSHAETPTAQELGPGYAAGTVELAEAFLSEQENGLRQGLVSALAR